MHRPALLPACLLAIAGLGIAQQPAPALATAEPAKAPAESPTLTMETTTVDGGRIAKGAPAEFVFKVKNTGQADLMIAEVRPSCGCTVANFDRRIAPGASGTIKATIDTARFQGQIAKTVTVKSNDVANPELVLTMKADIYALVEVLPSERATFYATRGEAVTKSFTIKATDNEGPALEISSVETNVPGLEHKLSKVDAGYQLDLSLAADAPIGPLAGQVKLKTNHPKVPEVTMTVAGNVKGPITVAPSAVFLPSKKAADMAQESRSVNLRASKDGTSFKVSDVKVDNPMLKAELTEVQPGNFYTVKVAFASAPAPGKLEAKLTIATDNPLQPMIEVPIRAQVKE
jgi:hypothetical protein